jgi:hypothetical protein
VPHTPRLQHDLPRSQSAQTAAAHPNRLVSCEDTQSVESACLLLPVLLVLCSGWPSGSAAGSFSLTCCPSSVFGVYERTTDDDLPCNLLDAGLREGPHEKRCPVQSHP